MITVEVHPALGSGGNWGVSFDPAHIAAFAVVFPFTVSFACVLAVATEGVVEKVEQGVRSRGIVGLLIAGVYAALVVSMVLAPYFAAVPSRILMVSFVSVAVIAAMGAVRARSPELSVLTGAAVGAFLYGVYFLARWL